MPYANNKISVIVEDQLPGFVRDDHNNFVQFVKSYYEFLELVNPPIEMPLRFENPDELVYNQYNQYGAGPFVVGEVIEQRANDTDPTIVTASATVYAFETTRTTKTVVVTSIGGTTGKFIRNKEIVGATSGVKYWSEVDLEQAPTGALQASYDISNLRDLDLMTDQYIEFIQREIASGFPTNFADEIDKRTALKNLRDFYQSKGTENSFKLLFRLVFNEDIELYLPSEDMLRASVGEYSKRITIRSTLITNDDETGEARSEADIVGQEIVGERSGATAIVEKAQRIVYAGAAFTEIDISDKVGTFEAGELLRVSYVDAITNTPVNIRTTSYGLVDSITITDGGSNYAVGDRLTVTDSTGVGVIAQVSQVNETTGAVTVIEILDPGYKFTTAPDVSLDVPHSGDAGSIRFSAGPLETLLDYKFEVTDTANSFFAESDNRGASSNTGAVGNDIYEVNGATIFKPHEVDANSFSNFVTIPGEKEGLQAWWKFDTYPIAQDNIKINTLDGTFGDGNDPVANTQNQSYWGPRVGDSVFRVDPRTDAFGYGPLNPLVVNDQQGANAETANSQGTVSANSYTTAGLVGFKPLIIDSSGNGRHAWVQTANVLPTAAGFTGRANVFVRGAFTSNGIYQDETAATITTANSWVNGPDQTNQESLGGVVLRAHDDLRNANTQTWVLWYYPYGELGYFSGTYQNDSEWNDFDSENASFDGNTAPNIISRDWESYWAIQANTTSTASSDYHDVLLTFQGATFDNGNPVSHSQVANTTGHYPGSDAGTLNSGGGSLRAQTWNMIAMSIDHTAGVGNVFFYNTYDGFHSSNGFAIPTTQDANTTSAGGWPTLDGDTQGRAVVLGAASASANGDSNGLEQNPATSAHGRFAEVRYYDQALDEQQITHLFKNPGGRFDKTLTGDWAIVNPDVSGNTATAVVYDGTEESYVVRVGRGEGSTGLQLIYNEDIEFDANSHYKMTVKANNSAGNSSNVQFGLVGVSNNGADLIGYDGSNDWDKVQPIVQSGTLTNGWVEKTAVFGGNTSQSGWSDDGSGNDGTENYTWDAPAKLHGDSTLATSNTTTFRPVLRWDSWSSGESTDIEYVKIEAQRPAKLTATVAGEFSWAGSITGDAGKLSSSAINEWVPKHLSDNSFYQTYSYVIRSGLSINRYKDLVDRLVHTSGKRLFGEVDWVSPVSIKPAASSFVDSILQLFIDFYGGSESLLIGEGEAWDARSLKGDVAIKSDFGLYDLPDLPFDLDLAHGEFDYSYEADEAADGDDYTYLSPEGPAWIAWDQSPADNPYANSHYDSTLLPDPQYTSSNTATRPTKDTLIWEVNGAYAKLVTGFEDVASFDGEGDITVDFSTATTSSDRRFDFTVTGGATDGQEFAGVSTNATVTEDASGLVWGWSPTSETDMQIRFGGANNPAFNFKGSHYQKVRVVVERTGTYGATWIGESFYGTDESMAAKLAGGALFAVPETGSIQRGVYYEPSSWVGEQTIEIDFSADPLWNSSNIRYFRLDFDSNKNGSTHTYLIKSITFVNTGPKYALSGHADAVDNNDGVYKQCTRGLPLDIDSSKYRYVRMKVRRIGPGGYGEITSFGPTVVDTSDWIGACQAETTKLHGASHERVEVGGTNIGANTIPQPSTLIVPAGSDPDTKSPWHILEWDMHNVGAGTITWPTSEPLHNIGPDNQVRVNGGAVTATTIASDIFATENIGWLGITLTGDPIEDSEKFEIDWIQVDDGTKYPRGSHQWPIGRTDQVADLLGTRNQYNDGSGVGGNANTLYVNSSWDYSTRPMGQFSARVSTPGASEIKFAETGANNATVVYISTSAMKVWASSGGATAETMKPLVTTAESHVFRASANTANATDWILSTQLYANNDLYNYDMMSDSSSTANFTPVTLELTDNDTLFVGHLYHEDARSPGTQYFVDPADQTTDDPRPFMLFHYQPFANTEPFDQYGTSNTYTSELVLFGNTSAISSGGESVEVSGHGFRSDMTGVPLFTFGDRSHLNSIDTMINYRGHHFTVGRGSQNVLLTKPAPGKSRDGTDAEVLPLVLGEDPRVLDVPYADGLSVVRTGPDRSSTIGVESFEIANTLTLDTSGTALGEWNPHAIIEGPKGSFFVACNNYTLGSDTVYCYHIVPTQNVSTGEMTALTVAPVYANTAHTSDLFQGCTGMAIDNLDPPNFYYATANTIHKIEPKGYSYEIGDTKMTELLDSSATAWDTLHGTGTDFPPLGGYSSIATNDPGTYGNVSTNEFMMEGTYCRMKVDRYNRLFLRGRANVYLYDTNTDELSVAYAPHENQTDIDTVNEINASYDGLVIFDFDVEPETGELVFLIGDDTDGDMIAGSVRPNTSLSYTAGGGQLVQTIIQPALTPGRYETAIPSGIGALTRFASSCAGKIRIRKRKDDGQTD